MKNMFDYLLKDNYSYEITDLVMSCGQYKLNIHVALNFVVPFEETEKQKEKILKMINEVKGVDFIFEYKNMVENKDEIVRKFLPYMISAVGRDFQHFIRTINDQKIEMDSEGIKLFAVGKVMCDHLNKQCSRQFQDYLLENFGIEDKVIFINDEKVYEEARLAKEKASNVQIQRPASTGKSETKEKQKPREYGKYKREKEKIEMVGNRVMGKAISKEPMKMIDFSETSGDSCVSGEIFEITKKDIRNGKKIGTFLVTDGTSSICAKTFASEEKWQVIEKNLKPGSLVKMKGNAEWDSFANTPVLMVKDIEKLEGKQGRVDTAEEKRVELHAHTKMSSMDGLQDVKQLINTAKGWGHKAVAVTDHGVCQAFPDAARAAGGDIKVLYGIEGYLLDDEGLVHEDGCIDFKKKKTNHIIILAKTQEGLKNLYKIVSLSHLDYFYKKPRIPRTILVENRQGLILGSACEAGELFQAVLNNEPKERIDRLVNFYDYLEIQPLINNQFLVDKGFVENKNDLIELNRKIVKLGEEHSKLVVATCDAHYTNEGDSIYRKILMSGQGYKDLGEGGLYLRTTDEMLEEFSYLGEAKAKEVVVTNPNIIADSIEQIRPVPKGKFPPHIDKADVTLRQECYDKAHSLYGDPLPERIQKRLDDELSAIIDEGYAVMYVSAQMLVRKSMEDGYLVGSRGSVGSSFAATMAGITEVNPLPPHYICPNCKNLEWGDESEYDCGVDMPIKNCPVCGTKYNQEGFTIPFETFLGIPGKQKEPDIDLNFAGEYQPIAHKYVDEIFGSKNVFKAGTIGTIAGKTAYGFVMKYFEERQQPVNKYEVDRLTKSCEGVKRTTGQHPGGIIILPEGHEIYEFCPVQHPANDASTGIITTHFDYHAIDENLLKLDILGHDAPSMIRQLQDMTGLDPMRDVPLKDDKVNSLFLGIEALDIKDPDYLFTHGSYGIPEFGTKFVRQMLDDTKPSKFADLVRISGFSHGTNVWLGNAQYYIKEGIATMNNAISTRDDIMNYLIQKGVPSIPAFTIMEKVRKGKGVSDEEAQLMTENQVPDWYIDSCRAISYMFPRAHAVAYVTMAYRIAYFKVYYPAEFYAVYLTTKRADFNWDVIKNGSKAILKRMEEISLKGKNATKKEEDEVIVLEICYEMYSRGYEFENPNFEHSRAVHFSVLNGKVLVPFCALNGVGDSAGKSICQEYKIKPFETIEEIKERAKANKTAIESLRAAGVLAGLPETDQLSLF
ncbi:MAG: PolC-type DNA polymerase III [Anaerovoracaceae bacterium]